MVGLLRTRGRGTSETETRLLEIPRKVRRGGWGVRRQQDWTEGCLGEVKIIGQIAKLRCVLPYVGARVGPSVCSGIESRPAQEVVFDELEVGIRAENAVLD